MILRKNNLLDFVKIITNTKVNIISHKIKKVNSIILNNGKKISCSKFFDNTSRNVFKLSNISLKKFSEKN